MKIHRIVPVSMCFASMLALPGCDRTETASTNVKAASQQAPAAAAATPTAPADQTRAERPRATPVSELSLSSSANETKPVAEPAAAPAFSTVQIVKAEVTEINLGDIPTNDSKTGTVRLVNTGDRPMTIISARPSCGCTAMRFQPNTILPPGETIEVEVQMSGGAKPGPITGKTVTFIVEGQPEVIVTLNGNAVSFVVHEPSTLDPEISVDGTFTLRSIDDQPFRIMSIFPQVVDGADAEARVSHELTMNWDKYREQGISRQVVVHLDHPKCNQVFLTCHFKPEEYARNAADMQRKREMNKEAIGAEVQVDAPAMPTSDPDAMLANMIKEGRNAEVLQRLQSGLQVEYRDQNGTTLLGMAARVGNADLVKALINANADISATDNVGRTALMHAASSKKVDAVHVLLDAGANPSTRDNLGGTALSWAAWLGDVASVQALLDAGSDVEVVGTITGWTPLMLAAAFGEPAAIDLLVDAHANLEAADMLEGATPLIHAARTGKVESIKALLRRGAQLENPDRNGNTALLACARTSGGDVEKLKVLIEAGANIHAKDNRGLNALELAQRRTDIRAAEIIALLEPLLGAKSGE